MANQSFGMVIGQGGADTMISAMVSRLGALGGTVRLNAKVAEILRDGRRATAFASSAARRFPRSAR
jgi:phytoene dehydrogenase-like protein